MAGAGGGKKGASSGSVDVDVDSDSVSSTVLDIVGLDDIDVTTTSNSSSTNRLELPDPIDTRMTISVPDTIRTDQNQRSELAITEPIVTQMSTDLDLDVDVKPVVMDLCLTLGIKDPPRFRVSRPYDKHLGMSLFGREVIGFDWCGTSDFIVDDVRAGGFTAGVTDGTVHRPRRGPGHRGDDHDYDDEHREHHREHHGEHHGDHDDHRHDRDERPGLRFVID